MRGKLELTLQGFGAGAKTHGFNYLMASIIRSLLDSYKHVSAMVVGWSYVTNKIGLRFNHVPLADW